MSAAIKSFLQNSLQPPEIEINSLKMARGIPCGGLMDNSRTRNPFTLCNAFISAQSHLSVDIKSVQPGKVRTTVLHRLLSMRSMQRLQLLLQCFTLLCVILHSGCPFKALSVSFSVGLSVCLSVSVSLCLGLSVSLSLCLSVCLYVCLCLSLSLSH